MTDAEEDFIPTECRQSQCIGDNWSSCLLLTPGESWGSYLGWIPNKCHPTLQLKGSILWNRTKMNMKMVPPSNRKRSMGCVVFFGSPSVLRCSQGPLTIPVLHPLLFPNTGPRASLWMQGISSLFSLNSRSLWCYLGATALSGWCLYGISGLGFINNPTLCNTSVVWWIPPTGMLICQQKCCVSVRKSIKVMLFLISFYCSII